MHCDTRRAPARFPAAPHARRGRRGRRSRLRFAVRSQSGCPLRLDDLVEQMLRRLVSPLTRCIEIKPSLDQTSAAETRSGLDRFLKHTLVAGEINGDVFAFA